MELQVVLDRCGVTRQELAARAGRLRQALSELERSPHAGFLRVTERRELHAEIARFARARRGGYSDLVQLGIGGSSLGAQALCRALVAPARSELRCHFPDNVDPESFAALLDSLEPRRTLVHVVSKSGGTLETQAQLFALIEAFQRRRPRWRLRDHAVATTGPEGILRAFAEREGIPMLSFPADVPGRYSVLTASGLLAPALCGVAVTRILAGARRMHEACRADVGVGPAGALAAVHAIHDLERRRPIHVELIYGDALLLLGDWFRQIWAESLGKSGRGPTPVVARGTTDQHSQIQLYMEGPDDKLYTVLRSLRRGARVRIARAAQPVEIAGRDMADVFEAEAAGTLETLAAAGRPIVELRLPARSPELVGELLFMQQLQTALAAVLYDVDAFAQPGVEAGKRAALRILRERPPAGAARGRAVPSRRGTRSG